MSNMFKFTLVSVLTLGLFSMPSFAQEAEAENADADVEEVIITGSRIKEQVMRMPQLQWLHWELSK